MKLVLATPLYPPEIGGPATYTYALEQELRNQKKVEVQVVKFSEVRHLPPGVRHIYFAWLIYRAVRRGGVVYAQDTVSVGWPAYVASAIARAPLLVRVPGDHVWEQARQRFGYKGSIDTFPFMSLRWHPYLMFLRGLQHVVLRGAKAVVVPSNYFAKTVAKLHVPRERIKVIYNGIASDTSVSVASESAIKHPCVVTVGRLVPWKGFKMLISTLVDLPEWHLVIIGDGPERQALEAHAATVGVGDRVVFTGALSRAEVFGWYAHAECFVLNTAWESFSYQTVEAMAVGIPVIATNVCSLPELVEHEKEGLLVRPDDKTALVHAIKSTTQERALWEQRTAAAKQKAKSFSIERTSQQVVELCRSVSPL